MNTVKINSGNAKMIAHRGLSGIERENTNAAFVAAGNRSYYGIETDVHLTKDGRFVIIHDSTTDRVSEGMWKINVEECDFSAIDGIVLPDKDGAADRRDIKIPFLKEYISICKKYEKICVLEIKNRFAKDDMDRMIAEIESVGYIENVIFISFDLENCINVREKLPKNKVQWLVGGRRIDDEMIKILRDNKIDLDIEYTMLNEASVKILHENGIAVNAWTCDDAVAGEKLAEWGVDFITTNILE